MGGFLVFMKRYFEKPSLTIEAQLNLLKSRGLIVENADLASSVLEQIGFYRLSGYSLPYQIGGNGGDRHKFKEGACFAEIYARYEFDQKFRHLLMQALERIEVSLRSFATEMMSEDFGPFWFFNPDVFKKDAKHKSILDDIRKKIGHGDSSKKRDIHIKHYFDTYYLPELPPSWMIMESVSFGSVSHIVSSINPAHRRKLKDKIGLADDVIESWLHALSYLRNLCAHHARLLNRTPTLKPKAPNEYKTEFSWIDPQTGQTELNQKLYPHFVAMQRLLTSLSPAYSFFEPLSDLIESYPPVLGRNSNSLGFVAEWQMHTVWRVTK
jgi:abortive infection bacteriophage resistance protein